VNQLTYAVLAFFGAYLAVEVFAANDVRSQLAPAGRHFTVGLLEQYPTVFVFDRRTADIPTDGVKGIVQIGGTESRIVFQTPMKLLRSLRALSGVRTIISCIGGSGTRHLYFSSYSHRVTSCCHESRASIPMYISTGITITLIDPPGQPPAQLV